MAKVELRRPWRYSPACRRGSERPNSSPKRACNSLSSDRHSKILATLKRRPAAIHHRSQRYSPHACKLNCSTRHGGQLCPPVRGGSHDPECDCREAEVSVQGRLVG